MRNAFLLFLVLAACIFFVVKFADATPQVRDEILYEGKAYSIDEYPLESCLNTPNSNLISRKDGWSSNNWKAYFAKWQIINNELWLIRFKAEYSKVSVSDIFPEYKLPIKASWYTGYITINVGGKDVFVKGTGFGSSKYVSLKIEKGLIVGTKKGTRVDETLHWSNGTVSERR